MVSHKGQGRPGGTPGPPAVSFFADTGESAVSRKKYDISHTRPMFFCGESV